MANEAKLAKISVKTTEVTVTNTLLRKLTSRSLSLSKRR